MSKQPTPGEVEARPRPCGAGSGGEDAVLTFIRGGTCRGRMARTQESSVGRSLRPLAVRRLFPASPAPRRSPPPVESCPGKWWRERAGAVWAWMRVAKRGTRFGWRARAPGARGADAVGEPGRPRRAGGRARARGCGLGSRWVGAGSFPSVTACSPLPAGASGRRT